MVETTRIMWNTQRSLLLAPAVSSWGPAADGAAAAGGTEKERDFWQYFVSLWHSLLYHTSLWLSNESAAAASPFAFLLPFSPRPAAVVPLLMMAPEEAAKRSVKVKNGRK